MFQCFKKFTNTNNVMFFFLRQCIIFINKNEFIILHLYTVCELFFFTFKYLDFMDCDVFMNKSSINRLLEGRVQSNTGNILRSAREVQLTVFCSKYI